MLIDSQFYLKKAHDFNVAWKNATKLLENPEQLSGAEHRYWHHKAEFMRQQKNNCQIMAIRQAYLLAQDNQPHNLIFYLDPEELGEVYSLSVQGGNRCHIPKRVLSEHLTQDEFDFIVSLS